MYLGPQGSCTSLVHLLISHPILAIALGLSAAAAFLSNTGEGVAHVEALVADCEAQPEAQALMRAAAQYDKGVSSEDASSVDGFLPPGPFGQIFWAIQVVESNVEPIGIHPDAVSYGPAGLTRVALQQVYRSLPDCGMLGFDSVLMDPVLSTRFAYLYFLDLVHQFGDIETAIIAYNFGPTRTQRYLEEGKQLPTGYLDLVQQHL